MRASMLITLVILTLQFERVGKAQNIKKKKNILLYDDFIFEQFCIVFLNRHLFEFMQDNL